MVDAHPHLVVDRNAADGSASTSQGVISGATTGTHRLKIVVVDREDNLMAGLDGARQVVSHRGIDAHHEQNAAIARKGVDIVREIGGQSLLAIEDAVIAHAVNAIGVPHGVSAQVDAHGEAGYRLVVNVVATACHHQRE